MKRNNVLKLASIALAASFCFLAQPAFATSCKSAGPGPSETAMSKCSKDTMGDAQQPAYKDNTGGGGGSCNSCGKCSQSCAPQKKPCPKPCPKACPEPCAKCQQCPAKPKCNQCPKQCDKCSSCGSVIQRKPG